MPFLYDIPERQFPATEQVSEREWFLEKSFWHIHPKSKRQTFIPKSGEDLAHVVWLTDYRSGPDWLDGSVPKQGKYSAAWLKHDWGYASESKPRRKLDWELLEDLQELGANWYQRNKVWLFVRSCGWNVWRKHDKHQVARLRAYAQFLQTGLNPEGHREHPTSNIQQPTSNGGNTPPTPGGPR